MTKEQPISIQTALIYLMIVVAGSDQPLSDAELSRIGQIVRGAPVFDGFNQERLIPTAQDCGAILAEGDGLLAVLGLVRSAIPVYLTETAYCLACEVAAADGRLGRDERTTLDMVRATLSLDRLVAAAIERTTAARWRRLEA